MKKVMSSLFVIVICVSLLSGCGAGERIDAELPLFIKTIDRPNDGVGEVVLIKLRVDGYWSDTDANDGVAAFSGILGSIDHEGYGGHYDDPKREVEIAFTWNGGHWVGNIPYISTCGESKMLTVYTDEAHSVWVFESEDRASFAPADHIDDVLEICEILGIELK